MSKRRNPNDAVVGNVKALRADVRRLQKKLENEIRYYMKRFADLEASIWNLGEAMGMPFKVRRRLAARLRRGRR